MKKGDLVRLNPKSCFTMNQPGGGRLYPLTNYHHDEEGTVEATRLATDADVCAWRDSDDSKGMTSSGETKLPPTCYAVRLHRDRVYTLLRGRCRPTWSYRQHPGMALILCSETGFPVYIKRDLLEVAI